MRLRILWVFPALLTCLSSELKSISDQNGKTFQKDFVRGPNGNFLNGIDGIGMNAWDRLFDNGIVKFLIENARDSTFFENSYWVYCK